MEPFLISLSLHRWYYTASLYSVLQLLRQSRCPLQRLSICVSVTDNECDDDDDDVYDGAEDWLLMKVIWKVSDTLRLLEVFSSAGPRNPMPYDELLEELVPYMAKIQ